MFDSPSFRHLSAALLALLILPGCTREMKEKRFISKADDFYAAGKYDEAKIEYLNALRLDYKNAKICQRLGDIWVKQGDTIQALRYLSAASPLAPNDIDTHSELGNAYLVVGDVAAARKEALTVLKLAPDNGEALLRLANCVRTLPEASDAARQVSNFPNHQSAFYHLANAVLLFATRQPDAGEREIRAAIAADPKCYQAHAALGDIEESRRDLTGAAKEFQTVSTLVPTGNPAALRYSQFLVETGSMEQAVPILADIANRTPVYLPAAVLEAQVEFGLKKGDDALKLVSDVLKRDPENLDAHVLQADIWLSKDDTKDAIQDLQNLAPPFSNLPIVKFRLAKAFVRQGDTAAATEALKKAIAGSPDYVDALQLMAAIDINAGNAQAVVEPMQKVLKLQPDAIQARLLLAAAYRTLKRYDDAIEIYRQELSRNPKDAQASFMIGMTEREKGDPAAARNAFENTQRLAPTDIMSTYQLVDLDIAAGDFAGAMKRVQNQTGFQSHPGAAQFLQGRIFEAQKDWQNSLTAYTNALAEDPKLSLAAQGLIRVYLQEGQLDKAVVQLQDLLKQNPADAESLSVLGDIYQHTSQQEKEQAVYEQLLKLQPKNLAALNNLAYIYSQSPDMLDRAMDLADSAHTLAPDNPGIADTYAWILFKKGKFTEALNIDQDCATKIPRSGEIAYHLAMANYMMDNTDAALAGFKQAAASPDAFPGKGDLAQKIAFLEQGGFANASPDQIQAALKSQPNDPYAWNALGDAWLRQGDNSKAAEAYQKALDQNPNLASTNYSLAVLYAGPLHNPAKAEDFAKTGRELAPNDPRADSIVGQIDYAKGQYSQAYDLLGAVVTSATNDAAIKEVLDELAWSAYSQGKIPEAREDMQRVAAAAAPGSPVATDAQSFLSLTATDTTAQTPAALAEAAAKMLQSTPDFVPALMIDGQSRAARGDADGAAKDYLAVLQRFPDFPPAQRDLAGVYLGNPAKESQGYDLAMKAHTAMPDDDQAAEVLAELSYHRKDYSYAAQLLQDTAGKGPLDADALFCLGMSLCQTHQLADGQEALRQSVAAGLKEPKLSEANKVLTQGKK